MRRRRSILDLPPSGERDGEGESSDQSRGRGAPLSWRPRVTSCGDVRPPAAIAGDDSYLPDYARSGQPMTFRRWIRMAFGPAWLPGGNRPQYDAFVGSWALFAVIGLFIPENILEREWTRNFCDFMASIVPQIDHVTDLDLRPEVNRFHYSLMWAFAPLYMVMFFCAFDKNFTYGYVRWRPLAAFRYALAYAGIAAVCMFLLYIWGDPQTSRVTLAGYDSVLGRAIWAPLNVIGTMMFLVSALVLFLRLITGRLNGRKGGHHGG